MKKELNSPVVDFFGQISSGAMRPRPYKKKKIPNRVTVSLDPDRMETLNVISDRIGASRAAVAQYILEAGIYEAAIGCGFSIDENGNIPEEEKGNWDTSPKKFGFSHTPSNEEE